MPTLSGGTIGAVLAAPDRAAPTGPLGLFIIVLLGIATVLLIRSMNKHLRRIPPTFDPPEERGPGGDPGDDRHSSP